MEVKSINVPPNNEIESNCPHKRKSSEWDVLDYRNSLKSEVDVLDVAMPILLSLLEEHGITLLTRITRISAEELCLWEGHGGSKSNKHQRC